MKGNLIRGRHRIGVCEEGERGKFETSKDIHGVCIGCETVGGDAGC